MDDPIDQSEARDFGEILSQEIHGRRPLVVGGHAVNIWAHIFKDRIQAELERENLLPLTSKDLDLYGSRELLEELGSKFGGSIVWGEVRSPVIGQLDVTLGGKRRNIEVLRNVRGMSAVVLESEWLPVIFEGYEARVPTPTSLLRAKLANLTEIDQTDRNDLRHVRILLLVVREYLNTSLQLLEKGDIEARVCVRMLEETRALASSDDAKRHLRANDISFEKVWPKDALLRSEDEKIGNFVRHRLSD